MQLIDLIRINNLAVLQIIRSLNANDDLYFPTNQYSQCTKNTLTETYKVTYNITYCF